MTNKCHFSPGNLRANRFIILLMISMAGNHHDAPQGRKLISEIYSKNKTRSLVEENGFVFCDNKISCWYYSSIHIFAMFM